MFLMALTLAAAEPPPRPMEVEVVRDPITDHVRGYATLREGRNRLVVSCDSSQRGRIEIAVHAERWLERGNPWSGYRAITHRFDAQRRRRMMWDVKHRHATLRGRSRVDNFLAHLMAAQRLVIRTHDIERNRLDMTFRLVGVRPAVEQATAACSGKASATAPAAPA
jgi:hypothetical protein